MNKTLICLFMFLSALQANAQLPKLLNDLPVGTKIKITQDYTVSGTPTNHGYDEVCWLEGFSNTESSTVVSAGTTLEVKSYSFNNLSYATFFDGSPHAEDRNKARPPEDYNYNFKMITSVSFFGSKGILSCIHDKELIPLTEAIKSMTFAKIESIPAAFVKPVGDGVDLANISRGTQLKIVSDIEIAPYSETTLIGSDNSTVCKIKVTELSDRTRVIKAGSVLVVQGAKFDAVDGYNSGPLNGLTTILFEGKSDLEHNRKAFALECTNYRNNRSEEMNPNFNKAFQIMRRFIKVESIPTPVEL